MKTILVAASTVLEIRPLIDKLNKHYPTNNQGEHIIHERYRIKTHVSGPGIPFKVLGLTQALTHSKPDYLLHLGIAGAYEDTAKPGDVVEIIRDRFNDIGAEDLDGSFLSMFHLGLWDENRTNWTGGVFENARSLKKAGIRQVEGSTVNTIPGSPVTLASYRQRSNYTVETMEGAAIFLVAGSFDLPFSVLCGISNYIGPRNRSVWEIDLAVNAVCQAAVDILDEGLI